MSHLAVSSFSLHTALGPLTIDQRQEDGSMKALVIDFPRRHSIEEFIDLAREKVGVHAIELCQIQFDSADEERIALLRAHLDAAGVRLLTLPIDTGDLAHPNAAWRADDERRIIAWFEIARTLGARFVRVNAGVPGTQVSAAQWGALAESLRRLGDAANNLGLRLLVENHGGASSTPAFLRKLLAEVGSERLGLLLDIGNFEPLVSLSQARFADPDVEDQGLDLEPIYDAIAELVPLADVVHAKSVDPASDGTPLPDLERALSIVADSGYRGSIAIEWEGRRGDPWDRTAAIAEKVRSKFPHLL